ncbi:hypothetical protein BD410DRAFT_833282 [Rickenella mellea]|uniref:Uncharacterized protein n=1 Tax=Rickenella mellea TaxID=50990 RepID=A0A4Y7PEF5_9AGAM|nr:hypothetical protein BD410DRAFT_833282 [Rickenella mellea]
MRFAASVLTLSLVATSAIGRSFVTRNDEVAIEFSFSVIIGNITNLDNNLNAFSTSSVLSTALVILQGHISYIYELTARLSFQAITSDFHQLDTAVNHATAIVQSSRPPLDEILNLHDFEAVAKAIIPPLGKFSYLKPEFSALPDNTSIALACSDLEKLSADTKNFENALIEICPLEGLLFITSRYFLDPPLACDALAIP